MPPLHYVAESPKNGDLIGESGRISVSQKITALHIDMRGYVIKVRALSQSRRGSRFTLHEATAERAGPGKELQKVAVMGAVEDALKKPQ